MIRAVLSAAAALVLSTSLASALDLQVSWAGTGGCFDPASPVMTVNGAPKGTASLRFVMMDLDYTSFDHGGGTIAYAEPKIAKGAFTYKGPCPPSQHRYRWTVWALDAGGKELGKAVTVVPFPPK